MRWQPVAVGLVAFGALAALAGCNEDVCADWAGRACIAVEVTSSVPLRVDQIRIDSTALGISDVTPVPPRPTPVDLPVQLAVIPSESEEVVADLKVTGLAFGNEVGTDLVGVNLPPKAHLRVVAHLVPSGGDGADLAGADLAGADFARVDPAHADLATADRADLAFVTPSLVPAQGGLFGGPVSAVSRDGSGVFYAGTFGGGMFKSASGSDWTRINNGLPELSIEHVAADPTRTGTVYADSFNLFPPKIFRTSDGGSNWAVVTLPAAVSGFLGPMAVDPGNGKPLFVFAGDVYRADDGVSFAVINGSSPLPKTGSSSDVPFQLLFTQAGHALAVASSGVFRSVDGGVTWAPANTGLPATRFLDPMGFDPSTGALYVSSSQIFKSTNDGQSWSQLTGTGLPSVGAFGMAAGGGSVFTFEVSSGGTSGVQRSTNDGANFADFSAGLPELEINALLPLSSSSIFAATRNSGIFFSSGSSFSDASTGMNARTIWSLAVLGQRAWAGSIGTVFKTTDGGLSWVSHATGLPSEKVSAVGVDPNNPLRVFAGLNQFQGIYRSTDGGLSWVVSSTGLGSTSEVRGFVFDPRDATSIWAVTSTGPFHSADGGSSWAPRTSGMTRGSCCANLETTGLVMDPTDSLTLWAASRNGVWITHDGMSWTSSLGGDLGWVDIDHQRSPRRLFVTGAGTIFRSDDGGSNWTDLQQKVTVDGFTTVKVAVDPRDGSRVFAADRDGCFFSGDAGASWKRIDGQLAPIRSQALVVDFNHVGWLGTSAAGGLFLSF